MKFIFLFLICFSMLFVDTLASDQPGAASRLAQEAENRVKKRLQDIQAGIPRSTRLTSSDVETPLIVGGDEVGDEEWPWVAAILSPPPGTPIDEIDTFFTQFCGGTLISKRIVLSAAHCFNGSGRDPDLYVSLGREDLTDGSDGEIIKVSAVITQPIFQGVASGFDAAILILEEESSFEPIGILEDKEPVVGETATALGWGLLVDGGGFDDFPEVLNRVDVPIVGRGACNAPDVYDGDISATMVCAGLLGVGGKDSCQGDSGGPLVVKRGGEFKLVGITSFGLGCALPEYPGVYALAPKFSQWINFMKRFETRVFSAVNANFNGVAPSVESNDQLLILKDEDQSIRSKLLSFNDRNGLVFDVVHQPLPLLTPTFSSIDQFLSSDLNVDQQQDVYIYDKERNVYGIYTSSGDGTFQFNSGSLNSAPK